MYQFYYADKAKSIDRKPCQQNIRDHFRIDAVRPTMWEEHCLECAAPTCFDSCVHYQSRSDGRCKRFENGLMTFQDDRACCGQGVHLKFRKWGNMMTILFPAMLPEADYLKLWKRNENMGKLLGMVESSPLPQSLRWQGIRIPEYLRRRSLRKLSGLSNQADAFLFHGYSYSEASYRLIVEIFNDHTPVYKNAISVTPGENIHVITNLSPECSKGNNLVKIYPENDLEAELDILWCDFVQGAPIAAQKPAAQVKCVVWDLDNTLWNGTLIETDDPNTLALNPEVRSVIEELDRRGIIQSIASKNEFDPAMQVLNRLGLDDYFLYPQIHWEPKSGSIQQIAKSLNIGIDSLALVDDTAFERNQVSSVHPQVRTYDACEISNLLSRPEFDVPVTAESRNRRAMYKAEEKRTAMMEGSHADLVEFIRKSNLRIHVFAPETEDEKLRCYELVVRTNQLNMSGVKYTPEEFTAVLARPDHHNFAFTCADDFGSYGIVGYGQYRIEGETMIFTEFAMSCRVAGKFVESALFSNLLVMNHCSSGNFTVKKTAKNILLRNTLEHIGFKSVEDCNDWLSYRFDAELTNRSVVSIT
jgi:FkbH-like protein